MTDRDWNELRNELHQTTDAIIKRSGRSIIAVSIAKVTINLSYTIGNHLSSRCRPQCYVVNRRAIKRR